MTPELLCRTPLGVGNPRGVDVMAAVTQLLNIILGSLMKLILKNEGFGITLDLSFRAVGCSQETWGAMKARNPCNAASLTIKSPLIHKL